MTVKHCKVLNATDGYMHDGGSHCGLRLSSENELTGSNYTQTRWNNLKHNLNKKPDLKRAHTGCTLSAKIVSALKSHVAGERIPRREHARGF